MFVAPLVAFTFAVCGAIVLVFPPLVGLKFKNSKDRKKKRFLGLYDML